MNFKTSHLRLFMFIYVLSITSILNSQITIGDCTNGGAAVSGGYSDANDANTNWNAGLETLSPSASNEQVTTHHAVNSGTTGAIGFVVSTGSRNLTNQACIDDNNRSAVLYAVGDCNGTPILPTTDSPGANYSNYEFTGLNPNTNYILVVTIDAVSDCDVEDLAVTYYSITPSGCNVSAGTYTVTIDGSPATDPNNVTLEDGETIDIVYNNDGTLPTQAADQNGIGYDIFSCAPTFDPNTEIPADDVCYLGTSFDLSFNISDDNNGGQSMSVAGYSELWFLPTTMDDMLNSANGGNDDGRGPDVDADGCWTSAQVIHVTYNPPVTADCGSCLTPNCPIGNVATYADRFPPTGAQTCVTGISVSGTYKTYQTVTSDNLGTLGAYVQQIVQTGASTTTITHELFAVSDCDGTNISASNNNVAGRSQATGAWNPEWYNLTPSTTYILVTTFTVTGTMTDYCMDYYYIPNPPDPCAMQNGSVQTCNCEFTDSGGNSSSYGASENNTFTICPDPSQTGAKIQLDFTSFDIEDGYDFMYVYDGNTATGQPIITVSGLNPVELNSTIAATISNTSGCLTVVFTSDFAGQNAGWTADVTCYTPCTTPIADASTVEFGTQQTIRMCPGDQLNFDGSTSTPNATSITTYAWDFDNGITGSSATEAVTFNDPGRYIPYLTVTNDEGCSSTNALPYEVIVSTIPNFNTTTADQTACEGDQVCLTGFINYPTLVDAPEVPPTGTVALPDGTGVAYETTVLIKGYTSGQTITSASDLLSVCVNMEHSAADDITITLISPTGETIVLHNRGGETMVLGNPILDANAYLASQGCSWPTTPSGPGTGLDYCFTSTATTTVANTADGNPNSCDQLPAGDYQSIDPFTNLIGSDINGTWTIRYEDASGNDDGYLFGWDLTFDPSLLPANATISPVIATQAWTGPATIDSNVDDVICVTPDNTGTNTYTYTVTNDFGCAADTTIDVNVTALETPTLGCGTTTLTSVEFTITNTLTSVTDYNVSYTINGGTATTANNVSFPYTVSSLNGGDIVVITVTPNGTGCYANGTGTCTANTCNSPIITLQPANTSDCEGQTATFTVTETGGNGTYSWEISTDAGANFTPLTDVGVYSGTGTATLNISDNTGLNTTRYRVVINEAVGSCPTTSSDATLTVSPSESPSITCGVSGEDSVEFNWTIPNGVTDYDLSYSVMGQTPISISNHTFNRLGVNGLNIGDTVVLTVTPNGTGCYIPNTNFCYTSCTPPEASFLPSPSKMNTLNPNTTMINSSSNATSYFWDFGDGETSTLPTPTKTYSDLDTGTYLITLTASNGTCTDVAYYYVKVFEDLVYYIPNTFTPDNNDFNALFTPVFTSGYDTGNYSMLIFNRWGELVYTTSEVNKGWDGKDIRNGKLCEDGTYIWKIEFGVKGIDKRETISGHLNLLR